MPIFRMPVVLHANSPYANYCPSTVRSHYKRRVTDHNGAGAYIERSSHTR